MPPPPEVVADDTPAVQAVLKADTKRLQLLEEEKRLQSALEGGDDGAAERLEKVWGEGGWKLGGGGVWGGPGGVVWEGWWGGGGPGGDLRGV